MTMPICTSCGRAYDKYCAYCFVKVRCPNCDTRYLVTRNYYYTNDYFPCDDCKDISYMLIQDDNPKFIYRRVVTIK